MKIGLLFTGISYGYYDDSVGDGRNVSENIRDYSHCFPNINIKLITPFQNSHDVKIYLTSYHNERENDILTTYNPTISTFLDIKSFNQRLTYIKSLEQIRNQDLDFVISTRFDIHFHKTISDLNIDYNKFNVLFREKGFWDTLKYTTDNFFAFKYDMLEDFIHALHMVYYLGRQQMDLHPAFYEVQRRIGVSNTHIISDIDELSHSNSIYSICGGRHDVVSI